MKKIIKEYLKEKKYDSNLLGIAGFCFFWSSSSLMIFALLPSFLVNTFNVSKASIGFIEGISLFISFIFKFFSGIISDYFNNRKSLIVIGSIFGILVKILFSIATTSNTVFLARFFDRLGKGIRASPTDALIADLSKNHKFGASYGLRQASYTSGAIFGSLLASFIMVASNNNYRLVFILSIIPALISFFILITFIKSPNETSVTSRVSFESINKSRYQWNIKSIFSLPKSFWLLLVIVFVLMMARFSEIFITLRAQEIGWPLAWLPLIIVGMDIIHAFVSYPVGKLSDNLNRYNLLFLGTLFLILANIFMIISNSFLGFIIGTMMVGFHLGITQGLLSSLIAYTSPLNLRGTAFSLYYLVSGLSVLLSNWSVGYISDLYGLKSIFYLGLFFSSICTIILFFKRKSIN